MARAMKRPALRAWRCPLCERRVTAYSMWREHRGNGGVGAVYFHGENERCFVANHRVAQVSSLIREIADPRENTLAETPE